MINFEHKKIKNGANILTAPLKQSKAMMILFLVGVGSRFENDKQAGISHFLEHMFFKGTRKRPSYKEITQELDYLGGSFNAYTSEEYTGYYIHAAADKFENGLDILSDMFFNSTFPEREVEQEKGVIVEEINMYEDQPMSKVFEVAEQQVYGKTELGRPIIGSKETVLKTNRQDLVTYHKKMYQPGNTIVAVAGDQLSYDWQSRLNQRFESWQSTGETQFNKWQYDQKKRNVSVIHRKTDQAHFVISYPTFPVSDKRYPALRVLSSILGGMMSSRLFEEIREKRGLAYYVSSNMDKHIDSGALMIRAGVKIDKAKDAIKAIEHELEKIKDHGVDEDELKRSKENLKGQIYLGLEDSESIATHLAHSLLYYNKVYQPEEIVTEIQDVTLEQVKDLACDIFDLNKQNIAIIGPFDNLKI